MRIVCFDIGGVLVRISQTWQEASSRAQVTARNLDPSGVTKLPASAAMEAYQRADIDFGEYLEANAQFLGCTPEEAERIHNHILIEEYPGVESLVAELAREGIVTACLSNTNAPHWAQMAQRERFPTLNSLQYRLASHLLGVSKPDAAIYGIAQDEFGVSAGNIVFFDDSAANVTAAAGQGWQAFAVDPYGNPAAQMSACLAGLKVGV